MLCSSRVRKDRGYGVSTFAVGDIQGCYDALRRLLERISFRPAVDRLWIAGDLVNRGPDSLRVLRWARELGDRAVVVLGNHDLHLLAVACGAARVRPDDTLQEILEAPDRDELLGWLRRQRLMHQEDGIAMVHAGLLPDWPITRALELAREVERELRETPRRLFESMYGDEPSRWSDALGRAERHRLVINAMTRMRMLTRSGDLHLGYPGAPSEAPAGLVSRLVKFNGFLRLPRSLADFLVELERAKPVLGRHRRKRTRQFILRQIRFDRQLKLELLPRRGDPKDRFSQRHSARPEDAIDQPFAFL